MPVDLHSPDQLASELERLSVQLVGDDGGRAAPTGGGHLAALLPVQVAAGPVAVVVWQTGEVDVDAGVDTLESTYELVHFDGTRITGSAPMREALTLLAMSEAVTAALDPEDVRQTIDLLLDWRATTSLADGDALGAELGGKVWNAIELLQRLEQAVGDPDEPARLATLTGLDELGALTTQLSDTWGALERLTERWSGQVAASGTASAEDGLAIQRLWTALGAGRRGPLREPVAGIVERGRQAGGAFADDVLAG